MKIYKEKTGVLSESPVWVILDDTTILIFTYPLCGM